MVPKDEERSGSSWMGVRSPKEVDWRGVGSRFWAIVIRIGKKL